jgi:hypothetical protein
MNGSSSRIIDSVTIVSITPRNIMSWVSFAASTFVIAMAGSSVARSAHES